MKDRFIVTPFFLDQPSPELELLAQPGWSVNKPTLPAGDPQRRMSVLHRPIVDFVAGTITQGARPVSIAGDCCATIGVLAGLQRAGLDPVLIWLDAHGDFNTTETSPSGFLGGMPLAMIVGRGDQTMTGAAGLEPFPEEKVTLVGGRDLDPAERQALEGSAVVHLTDARALLDRLTILAGPLYVHFDTDIINPEDAPAMSYRAPGGPAAAELRAVFRALSRPGHVAAVSMTIWSPPLDTDGRSRSMCLDLLRVLLEG